MKKFFNKTIRVFGGGNIFIPKKIIKSEYPLNNTNGNNNVAPEPIVVPNNYLEISNTFIPQNLIIGFGTNPNVTENDFVNPIEFFKDENNKNIRLLCLYEIKEDEPINTANKIIDVNQSNGNICFNYFDNVGSNLLTISNKNYFYMVRQESMDF